MVQNKGEAEPKRRGRPRAYDPEEALLRAMDSFWKTGYSGTSLDEITAATGMNRPSLYAAFGDKRALYLKALGHYWHIASAALHADLAQGGSLSEALMRVYEGALSIYFSDDGHARGCFVIGTAVTEAMEDREVRDSLAETIRVFDSRLEAYFRMAQVNGDLKGDADPASLAILATATMHTIAVRARAGVSRADLQDLARKAVTAICG
jgi:AcrR family transcriptional regulator